MVARRRWHAVDAVVGYKIMVIPVLSWNIGTPAELRTARVVIVAPRIPATITLVIAWLIPWLVATLVPLFIPLFVAWLIFVTVLAHRPVRVVACVIPLLVMELRALWLVVRLAVCAVSVPAAV